MNSLHIEFRLENSQVPVRVLAETAQTEYNINIK
jgi:hypothetical protein